MEGFYLLVFIIVCVLLWQWYKSEDKRRWRCRMNFHKWSKPKTEQFKGVMPLTYQGCRYCPTERVK